jgi:hypothetical protein
MSFLVNRKSVENNKLIAVVKLSRFHLFLQAWLLKPAASPAAHINLLLIVMSDGLLVN